MTTPAGPGPDLEAFRRTLNERFRGTMMELIGCRMTAAEPGRVVLEMPFRPQLRQLTGLLHAGALITLAETAATAASLSLLPEAARGDLSTFSLSVQLSASLTASVREGMTIAEATAVHRGRAMHVVETRVTGRDGALLALVTSTHLLLPTR